MPQLSAGQSTTISLASADALIVSCATGASVASVAASTGFIGAPYALGSVVGESKRTFGPYGRAVTLIVTCSVGSVSAESDADAASPPDSLVSGAGNNTKRLKIVGRSFAFNAQAGATAGTDIGGTMRKKHIAVSQLTRLAGLVATHFWINGGAGATEDSTTFPRNIASHRLSFEAGGKVAYAALNGRQTFVVEPIAAAVQTDPVGVGVAAGGTFYSRLYIKPALPPSGNGSAAAVAGGALAAQTWYYVVTRVENGVESGPTAEINATTAASNLSVGITITDTRSAAADCYRIYRSSAAAGTKQFVGQTNGARKYFVDDGAVAVDTTVNPPAASNYRFNAVTQDATECTSHINAGGVGDDQTGATGTFGIVGPSFKFGTTPIALVGDDTSNRSNLGIGDSILGASGFPVVTGVYKQTHGFVDRAIVDGREHWCNAAYNGATLSELIASTQQGGGRTRLLLLSYADNVHCNLGTNDMALGASWSTHAANMLTFGGMCQSSGAKLIAYTITSRVTTTDNCLTIANQTKSAMEANRLLYNRWLRNGCQVDGSGAPVQSGGSPSRYISGVIDVAATVEVDASNVPAFEGGYWAVPTAPAYSGLVLTGSPSQTSFPVGGGGMGAGNGENVGRVILMTSGAQAGKCAVIAANSTGTALTLYANGDTTQSGVAVTNSLTGSPAAGDTFAIYPVFTNEGLHPAIAGHAAMSAAVSAWLVVN